MAEWTGNDISCGSDTIDCAFKRLEVIVYIPTVVFWDEFAMVRKHVLIVPTYVGLPR